MIRARYWSVLASWLLIGVGAVSVQAACVDRQPLSPEPARFRHGPAGCEGQARLPAGQPAGGADHDPQPAAVLRLHERAGQCVDGRAGPDGGDRGRRWTRGTSSDRSRRSCT